MAAWHRQSSPQEMKRVQLEDDDDVKAKEDNEEMDVSDEEPPAKRAKTYANEALKVGYSWPCVLQQEQFLYVL